MRKQLFTGFIIILPLALTLMVFFFLFDVFTSPFIAVVDPIIVQIQKQFLVKLPPSITLFVARIFSLIFLCVFILLLGMMTHWLIVRKLIDLGEKFMDRIPFVSTVYRTSREVLKALFSTKGKKAFKKPVMIPFPGKPNYSLGFLAGEVAPECQEKIQTPLVSVFSPTAPHPISGFLFLAPKQDVRDIDMTNEEVVKFLVSCGMILPESDDKEGDAPF